METPETVPDSIVADASALPPSPDTIPDQIVDAPPFVHQPPTPDEEMPWREVEMPATAAPGEGEDATADVPPAPASGDDATPHLFRCTNCNSKFGWKGELADRLLEASFQQIFTKGFTDDGRPNCPHCSTAMTPIDERPAPEAIAEATKQLAADTPKEEPNQRRVSFQPSLPGTLPAFDYREAQMRTEGLQRHVQSAKSSWEEAKEEASELKKAYDKAVESLCEHIAAQSRLRQEHEYKNGRGATAAALEASNRGDQPEAPAPRPPCIFEQTTGQACSICRSASAAQPPDPNAPRHVAGVVGSMSVERTLTTEILVSAINAVTGVLITDADMKDWSDEDRKVVVGWLERFANADEPWTVPIPLPMGRFHEAIEYTTDMDAQRCRTCGAVLKAFDISEGADQAYPAGSKVGVDCTGESAQEPARQAAPRHKDPKQRQRAKQAAAEAPAEAGQSTAHTQETAEPRGQKRAAKAGLGRPKKRR